MLVQQESTSVLEFAACETAGNSKEAHKRRDQVVSLESADSRFLPMLPPGWIEKDSEEHGKPCYVHVATRTRIWTKPTSSSVEQQEILTLLAAPFAPLALVAAAAPDAASITVDSKRKKEEEIATPKEKKPRKQYPVPDTAPDAATVNSKRKNEGEIVTPKEKKPRKQYPKPASASARVVTSDMVAIDIVLAVFLGATIYDLGGGCSVITLVDPVLQALLPAAIEFVLQEGVLEFDRKFTMFQSKVCTRHRGEGFFSEKIGAYAFSKDKVVAQALHATLQALLDRVNTFVPLDNYTAIMANLYRNMEDSIGAHSDKDVSDKEKIGVIAVSHGASRILSFRPIDRNNVELKQLNLPTESGQMLVMYGEGFQTKFTHGINGKKTQKPSDSTAPAAAHAAPTDNADAMRVSFTFRRHHGAAS